MDWSLWRGLYDEDGSKDTLDISKVVVKGKGATWEQRWWRVSRLRWSTPGPCRSSMTKDVEHVGEGVRGTPRGSTDAPNRTLARCGVHGPEREAKHGDTSREWRPFLKGARPRRRCFLRCSRRAHIALQGRWFSSRVASANIIHSSNGHVECEYCSTLAELVLALDEGLGLLNCLLQRVVDCSTSWRVWTPAALQQLTAKGVCATLWSAAPSRSCEPCARGRRCCAPRSAAAQFGPPRPTGRKPRISDPNLMSEQTAQT